MKLDLTKLWEAMPPDVQRKISLHDLKRTVDAYNGELLPQRNVITWFEEPEMVMKSGLEYWQYRTGGYDFETNSFGMCGTKADAEMILKKHWNR